MKLRLPTSFHLTIPKPHRYLYPFIILLSAVIVLGFFASVIKPQYSAQAKDGQIHLASLNSSAKALNGVWEYYENDFLFPSSFFLGTATHTIPTYVRVPGPAPNTYGYGTYRLVFDFVSTESIFAIKISDLSSAARIYIDGTLLSTTGFSSTIDIRAESAKDNQYLIFPLDTMRKTHDIIIQTSNYTNYEGGILTPVYFGTQMEIYRLTSQFQFAETIGIMSLSFVAIFLILILFLRIQMGHTFYLLSFTLCFTLYLVSVSQTLLVNPVSSDIFSVLTRASIALLTAMSVFQLLYLNPRQHPGRYILYIYQFLKYTACAILPLILFAPVKWLPWLHRINQLYMILVFAFCFALLCLRVFEKRYIALIQLVSLECFISLLVLQVLYKHGVIPADSYSRSFMIFVIIHAVAELFHIAFNVSRIYSGNLVLAKQMIVSNKMKNEMLSITSHELRTPLHGMINILEDTAASQSKAGESDLALALTLAKRMRSIVNDLYGFNETIPSGTLVLAPVNLRIELSAITEMYRYTSNNNNVTILDHLPQEASLVYADESRLWQVLNNLIGNATKFTTQGLVTISGERIKDKVQITVTDTGVGIHPDEAEEIFKKSVRLDDNGTNTSGLGLGLYVCRQLIEQMNGTIFVKWSEKGKGTCIAFELDACEYEEYAKSQSAAVRTISDGSVEQGFLEVKHPDYARILAVDDNPENLSIIKKIFEDCNFDIDCYTEGSTVLALLNQNTYDIVILDVMMPVISGFELSREIRTRYTHFELPILLLTARNTKEDILTGFLCGANDYIIKPADKIELRARVFGLITLQQSVKSAMDNELQFLQAQIRPHFLYNAFNTISSIALTDGVRASELIDDLGTYLRSCFDKNLIQADLVSISQELEMVHAYIRIEEERFGNRLHFTLDNQISYDFILPSLSIQPIVENAIRHGLLGSITDITVKVHIFERDEQIFIQIEDSGKGISELAIYKILTDEPSEEMGIGLRNVNHRMKLHYNTPLKFERRTPQGTIVTMKLPAQDAMRGQKND
ncbi:MAG: ATP-binding protein [Lachnospiraceae bacterium]